MKQEIQVICATAIGLLAMIGLIGLRKSKRRDLKNYEREYHDFHRNFSKQENAQEQHGIEYFSVL